VRIIRRAAQSLPTSQYRYRREAGLSNPIWARKEVSCSGVTKAPRTLRATLPGDASVIKKTATETRSMVRRRRRSRLTMNRAIGVLRIH